MENYNQLNQEDQEKVQQEAQRIFALCRESHPIREILFDICKENISIKLLNKEPW